MQGGRKVTKERGHRIEGEEERREWKGWEKDEEKKGKKGEDTEGKNEEQEYRREECVVCRSCLPSSPLQNTLLQFVRGQMVWLQHRWTKTTGHHSVRTCLGWNCSNGRPLLSQCEPRRQSSHTSNQDLSLGLWKEVKLTVSFQAYGLEDGRGLKWSHHQVTVPAHCQQRFRSSGNNNNGNASGNGKIP